MTLHLLQDTFKLKVGGSYTHCKYVLNLLHHSVWSWYEYFISQFDKVFDQNPYTLRTKEHSSKTLLFFREYRAYRENNKLKIIKDNDNKRITMQITMHSLILKIIFTQVHVIFYIIFGIGYIKFVRTYVTLRRV